MELTSHFGIELQPSAPTWDTYQSVPSEREFFLETHVSPSPEEANFGPSPGSPSPRKVGKKKKREQDTPTKSTPKRQHKKGNG